VEGHDHDVLNHLPPYRASRNELFGRRDHAGVQPRAELLVREITQPDGPPRHRYPNDREIAAGVVDIKNQFVETVETLADRIRLMLRFVSPERLWLVPDCGFSQTPRFHAFQKLRNLVKAAEIVRAELTGKSES